MTQTPRFQLLIVDDDRELRETMASWFSDTCIVQTASSGEEALALVERQSFDVGIFDMVMPGMTGLELMRQLTERHSEMQVIFLTGTGTIETAVEAMRLGAYDFLTKPCPLVEIERRCAKAYEAGQLRKQNAQLRALVERERPRTNMIGGSRAMQDVFRLIERAGPSNSPILILGESGTGKELVARALQKHSRRADQPFVIINCAALPEQLLESELFGHEKGAFTGAVAAKPGLFEVADHGTLFIDEIGELAPALQAKLLRVLEDGSFRRVGSIKERKADVRILAATNRNLADEVRQGRFREDLFYRINVLSMRLPPLRERAGDIPLLVQHFLTPDWTIEPDALRAIESYDWPGNVRQLINAIERAKILADDGVIHQADLPPEICRPADRAVPIAESEPRDALGVVDDLASIEQSHVLAVLEREKGNKARAARALGVNRRTLYRLLERYGVHQPD